MERQHRGRRGQAIVLVALAMVVLCGMAAVGVDVGMATSKQHVLRNAASSVALDARQLLADHASSVAPTNAMVWNSITASLANAGLSVRNATGTAAPADPCAANYTGHQVALTALYLNGQNLPVTDTAGNPVTITASSPISVPDGAAGVQIGLGACQPAAFGAVLGHPFYPIQVSALAGQPSIAATNTPGPTPTSYPTDTPTPTASPTTPGPTNTPTTTPTTTPTATSTSTSSPTSTPVALLCTFPIAQMVQQNQGFYTTFTTSEPGDIAGSWTVTTNSAAYNLYIGLYSGTPLGAGTGTSSADPTTDARLTSAPPKMDLVSQRATNSTQTESLDYTAYSGQQAAAGTYTVYFYNSNNKTDPVSGATITYLSRSCSGSATATPSSSATATATPTTIPTSTATVTPPPTATATPTPAPLPYAVSGAPDGLCNGLPHLIQPESDADAKYQPEEYYCPGVYSIGSQVMIYANGVGVGNNYGHDANFKGYIGNTSLWRGLTQNAGSSAAFSDLFNDEVDNPQPSGGGTNAPSAPCPATLRVSLISRVAHHRNADWFAPLAFIRVTVDNYATCGNPTTGVISGVFYDPDHIVNLPPGATPPYLP